MMLLLLVLLFLPDLHFENFSRRRLVVFPWLRFPLTWVNTKHKTAVAQDISRTQSHQTNMDWLGNGFDFVLPSCIMNISKFKLSGQRNLPGVPRTTHSLIPD